MRRCMVYVHIDSKGYSLGWASWLVVEIGRGAVANSNITTRARFVCQKYRLDTGLLFGYIPSGRVFEYQFRYSLLYGSSAELGGGGCD